MASSQHEYSVFQTVLDGAGTTCLIMLNQPVQEPHSFLWLWQRAAVRLCADGGANRLFDAYAGADRERLLPDLITGDLDSLRPDVHEFYRAKGVAIERVSDQDKNDLEKCMDHVIKMCAEKNQVQAAVTLVLAYGCTGARFDHAMAAVNTLFKYNLGGTKLVLMAEASYTMLLEKGSHRLSLAPFEGPACGLIPIGEPVQSVTTTGLRWNLQNQSMQFGHLISTSNLLARTPASPQPHQQPPQSLQPTQQQQEPQQPQQPQPPQPQQPPQQQQGPPAAVQGGSHCEPHVVVVETSGPLLWTAELNYARMAANA